MERAAPSAFEAALADLLLAELRRQGVPRVAEVVCAVMRRVRVGGGGGQEGEEGAAELLLGGAGLGDKGAIAVAEALLKLSRSPLAKARGARRWKLLLNDDGLTDRSAAHVALLAARCAPPLVLLDVRGNAMTPAALQRIEEAHASSPAPCVLRLPCLAGRGAGSRAGSVSSASASGRRGGVDAEALQRRRSALFSGGGRASESAPSAASGEGPGRPPSRSGGGAAAVELAAPHPATPGGRERAAREEEEEVRFRGADGGEPLDVAANLSPLLRVVLDLSNAVPTGRLRALYGCDDIWDVVASSGEAAPKAVPSARPAARPGWRRRVLFLFGGRKKKGRQKSEKKEARFILSPSPALSRAKRPPQPKGAVSETRSAHHLLKH
ncbi:uncharacterized protein Tco025E_09042 [Trypanosoma conorhini]|uniref:Uncharacterized protein n=1 Tax=Trypanosoma conorhini TaxID=83891 RepID=A0A3S5IQH0_9TRYP|nr:uncharacterized protein Tco025E_09042 [Trypanosoma conorhini]RNF00151.1 hypothetical protein Tco025E_09042 [Trypanosoma conorhini]